MKGDKRQKVLETVQEFKAGITIQELITLLVDDFRGAQEPERAVSQTLWRLSSAGLIERICVGASIPRWSHNQEVNRGVRVIRIVQKNGQVVDTPVDPANPITIAPLEE